jgi:hypothetical protein
MLSKFSGGKGSGVLSRGRLRFGSRLLHAEKAFNGAEKTSRLVCICG